MTIENFRYPKLRGRIIEKYQTYRNFSNALGTSEVMISRKLTAKSGFVFKDIVTWSKLLDISLDQIGEYFFAEEFSKHKPEDEDVAE